MSNDSLLNARLGLQVLQESLPYIERKILEYMFNDFKETVQETYPLADVKIIAVNENNLSVTVEIEVTEAELWFKEFGTGYVGMTSLGQSYIYRPKQTLSFFSRGEWQTTQGWEYAYHPETKEKGYWVYYGEKFEGRPPKSGVTKAISRLQYLGVSRSPQLKEYLRNLIREAFE